MDSLNGAIRSFNTILALVLCSTSAGTAYATSADFNSEFDCYVGIDQRSKIATGYSLVNDPERNYKTYKPNDQRILMPQKIMRKADERSPMGYFVYGRQDVAFIKVDLDKMTKECRGKKWIKLNIPGFSQPLYANVFPPSGEFNVLMPRDYNGESQECAEFANLPTIVENVDAVLARKVLLNDIEDGVKTVHESYLGAMETASQTGSKVPVIHPAEDCIAALKDCLKIPDQALTATINAEIAKFNKDGQKK